MCGGPSWKREVVPDHKFDFVDTRDFTDHGFWMRTRYLWVYILVLKSFLVYVSDIFTAITMLTTNNWSNKIFNSCKAGNKDCIVIPFNVGRWLFVGCIIFSFLLLAYESRKAKKIIASRDISYAFTNIMANNYYSLRSYDHFCFFSHINNSTKKKDDFAFFIFFTFKSWKRLLLADGPRQVINALTLYSFYISQNSDKKDTRSVFNLNKYTDGNVITTALIFSTLFTVIIFVGSALLLIAAGLCYIPLLCYIRGNLKEYCCHKVDKRIAEIVKRKNKERQAKAAALARKEAAGDFSHLKNKKGEFIHNPLPQPTLPNVNLDDDYDDNSSMRTRVAPNASQADYHYYADYKGNNYSNDAPDYPPVMPAQTYPYQTAHGYGQSLSTLPDEQSAGYDDEYSSQAYLPMAAAPFARQTTPHSSVGTLANPYDNRATYASEQNYAYPTRAAAQPSGYGQSQRQYGQGNGYDDGRRPTSGLAYDDASEYSAVSPTVPPRTDATSRAQNSRYNGPTTF